MRSLFAFLFWGHCWPTCQLQSPVWGQLSCARHHCLHRSCQRSGINRQVRQTCVLSKNCAERRLLRPHRTLVLGWCWSSPEELWTSWPWCRTHSQWFDGHERACNWKPNIWNPDDRLCTASAGVRRADRRRRPRIGALEANSTNTVLSTRINFAKVYRESPSFSFSISTGKRAE